jgi:mono/diheme cytochrome c family protein
MKPFANAAIPGLILTIAFACGEAGAEADACRLPSEGAGRLLYAENCTVCHGPGGKGGGPLARALNLAPPDLTALSKRTGGAFPAAHVLSILENGGAETSDGDKAMPKWSKIFAHECGLTYGQKATVELERYIESIQQR